MASKGEWGGDDWWEQDSIEEKQHGQKQWFYSSIIQAFDFIFGQRLINTVTTSRFGSSRSDIKANETALGRSNDLLVA